MDEAYSVYFIIVWNNKIAFLCCCGLLDGMCSIHKVKTIFNLRFMNYLSSFLWHYVLWLPNLLLSSSAPADATQLCFDSPQPTPNPHHPQHHN